MPSVVFYPSGLMGTMPLAMSKDIVKTWEMRGLEKDPKTIRILVEFLKDTSPHEIREIFEYVGKEVLRDFSVSNVSYDYRGSQVGEVFITLKVEHKQDDVNYYIERIAQIVESCLV